MDEQGKPTPKLVAEIPSLERGTWRVPADGMVQTTFRLRDNLYWHDGTPVTTDDVAFSLRVYQDPKVPVFLRAMNAVDRIESPDQRTFILYWRQPYALADQLTFREFTVLPRHLLEPLYSQDPEAVANAGYWTDGFVGSGPFRVQSWERGAHLELTAFEQYFLGKPKTERVIVKFIADENTALAQLLAGEIDLNIGAIDTVRSVELAPRVAGMGQFVYDGNSYLHWTYQYNNNPAAFAARDVRVRQALAHALDRVSLTDYATAGKSPALDSWIPPDDPRYPSAEPYITKYPFDAARAANLFEQAGWTRGSDGLLHDATGQPLRCVIRGADSVGTLGVQQWRAAGVDASEEPIPPNLTRDPEWRATFQCVESSSRNLGISKVQHLHSGNAMSAANNWRGNNRSGWSTLELDRLIDRFMAAMVEDERLQTERDIVRILTAELPLLPMYISIDATFLANGFSGWKGYKKGVLPDSSTTWNAHEWMKV